MCSPSPSPTNFSPATPTLTSFASPQPPGCPSSYSRPALHLAVVSKRPPSTRPPTSALVLPAFHLQTPPPLSSSPQLQIPQLPSLPPAEACSHCLPLFASYSVLSPVTNPLLPPTALLNRRAPGSTSSTPHPNPVGKCLVPVWGLTAATVHSLLPTTRLL